MNGGRVGGQAGVVVVVEGMGVTNKFIKIPV